MKKHKTRNEIELHWEGINVLKKKQNKSSQKKLRNDPQHGNNINCIITGGSPLRETPKKSTN